MEPISGLERLTALLRKKATEENSGKKLSKETASSSVRNQGRPSIATLEQQLQQKIKNLQQAEAPPSALQHALIESVLAWEFGEQVRNEPKFVALVNGVKRQIEEEPELKSALEKIYRKLV